MVTHFSFCKSERVLTHQYWFESPEKINEDATAHPGKAFNQKALKIYAVRANQEPMLDVARGTFKENIQDIHTCAFLT